MTYNPKIQDVVLALLRWAIQGEDEGSPLEAWSVDEEVWKETMEPAYST